MQLAQWVVIALSRDYHDVIERDASLLTALEPEEGPITPRIRVDTQWLRKRVRRRIRGTTRVPGFRWGFLQSYGRFWAKRTREIFPPASELEKQPWAFSGLAATRMLSMIPLVSCFMRPLIPVAAAHLIVAKRAAQPAERSKDSEPPAKPPDSSSASAA